METTRQNWSLLNFFVCLLVSFFIIMINGFDLVVAADQSTMRPLLEKRNSKMEADDHDQTSSSLKTYIVHVKKPHDAQSGVPSDSHQDLKTWYQTFLPSKTSTTTTSSSDHDLPRMVHAYNNVATGFAARLTPEEAKAMEKKDGFVSARPQKIFSLHTTYTPNLLGLFQGLGLWNDSKLGQGLIIGVLDTGIWPDHPSFSDEGMPPPPAKWRGKCDFNGTLCNNKLIGARNFVSGTKSSGTTPSNGQPPFDLEGHGTHTSSTAAGNFVPGANAFGNAKGTATGMAPLAHIAMYRVCEEGCGEADILAALDAAIDDGVDVLSLSLGGGSAPFYFDSIAIGAFAAIKKGIFVSCSAGNEGPDFFTLSNEAPWILTVGASTVDRKIKADVMLGNGEVLDGQSLNQPKDFDSSKLYPVVYAGAVSTNETAKFCAPGSLQHADVKGKVVACERGGDVGRIDKGTEVKNSGGFAMILVNDKRDGFSTLADAHVLPATHVSYAASLKIKAYTNSTPSPQSTILFKGTVIGDSNAPSVSSFSSRGPSGASIGILKPDIIGPGVGILAAWPVSVDNSTTSGKATFNMISGTSMSCPHLSGIAALLKNSHHEWSPAAIKSAIITTADVSNLGGGPILDENAFPANVFATGSGHVNPSKANNPGLIYDIAPEDYIPYLCGLGYTDDQVSTVTQATVTCSQVKSIPESQLNYPTISVVLGNATLSYTRTVTNVGEANSVYDLDVYPPAGTVVNVTPNTLTFTEVNQKAEYKIEISQVSGPAKSTNPFEQGYLVWKSDKYSVRSQITAIFAA